MATQTDGLILSTIPVTEVVQVGYTPAGVNEVIQNTGVVPVTPVKEYWG